MTPISQGMYEFKNESLIEMRKRMGIAQSKMAELLGIPANTLSRWETGNTVPDASALAAIYSLAKEHGLSDIPQFFSIRNNPLEVKIGSKPSNQPMNSLSSYHLLRSYLNTQIEIIGDEQAPVIKIEICNTATFIPDGPNIVFTGVGLSFSHTGVDYGLLQNSIQKMKISRKPKEIHDETPTTPWKHDSKRKGLLETTFNRTDHKEFPDITTDERQHGEILFPGQSIIFEMGATIELLPYIQFKVEGTVSRRHLFHYEEIFLMPESITKPLVVNAFNDFNTLDLYGSVESVISMMPKFDSNTRLEEVQAFSRTISESIIKNKVTQEEIQKIWKDHQFRWFRAHLRVAYIYLDRVNAVLAQLQEAIGSNSSDKIAAEISETLALRADSNQLNSETKELMRFHHISEEELKKPSLHLVETGLEISTNLQMTSPNPIIQNKPDELDLHGKTISEALPLVNRFLEDSIIAGKKRVWVVHGKGTGVLRQAIGDHLSKHKLVKSSAIADNSRGGDGATQLDLIG